MFKRKSIIKIQRPISSSSKNPGVLVYKVNKKGKQVGPASEIQITKKEKEILQLDQYLKVYYSGSIDKEGNFHLESPVMQEEWV